MMNGFRLNENDGDAQSSLKPPLALRINGSGGKAAEIRENFAGE